MDNVSEKIALLNRKLVLLEEEKKKIQKELKTAKKLCNHDYLVGGISIYEDEIYFCLCCGKKVFRSTINAKIMIDLKDYLTEEEYSSHKFDNILNDYYNLAKNKLNEMLIAGIPYELIEAALSNELVCYLEKNRNEDRGR